MALAAMALVTVAVAPARADVPIVPFTEEGAARGLLYYVAAPQTLGIYGFGSGFADLDGDGDPDLVAIGRNDGAIGIFENDGTGHFIDHTAISGIALLDKPSAFAAGDYDGDGDLDLYVTQIAVTGRLLRNDGGFHFTDVTRGSGATTGGAAKGCAWADIDADGDLDLHVACYRNGAPGTSGIPSSLFRNNGDGTFTDIGAAIPGFTDPAYTFSGTWVDFDRDGDPDLYTSNDRGYLPPFYQGNQLFRNDGGAFTEVSATCGAGIGLFSMGLGCADFDANGYADFYCTNIATPNQPTGGFNPLFLNQGDGTFVQGQSLWAVGLFITSWGCSFADFDNDGNLDLYVSNQWTSNTMLRNPGAPPAINVTGLVNCPGSSGYHYSSSWADVDGDGDLDLLTGDLGSNPLLYINHTGEAANAVRLRVVGEGGNRFAIGGYGLAWLDEGGTPRFRDIWSGGRSYLGADPFDMHVGLGERTTLPRFEMHLPKGPNGIVVRTLLNLPANQVWTVYPPARLGDADGDGQITVIDAQVFDSCSQRGFIPGCEMMDLDGDSDVDETDAFLFHHKASDFDGDGVVGPADLSILLGAWGTVNAICDLDASGVVGSADLALLLGVWG